MFDGTELKTLGMLTATVEHPMSRKPKRMDFYVVSTHDRAILGMRACKGMELLYINERNICSVRNDGATSDNEATRSSTEANTERCQA